MFISIHPKGVKILHAKSNSDLSPTAPFSFMLLWKLTELIYGMRACIYITLKNLRLCIGQKYELAKLKNQGKERQKKKLNCAAILASFNMPYQGATKYI